MTEPKGRAARASKPKGAAPPGPRNEGACDRATREGGAVKGERGGGRGPEASEQEASAPEASKFIVCAPLRPEARAVRRGLGGRGEVRRTGYGPARAAEQAGQLRDVAFGMLAIGGVGGGIAPGLKPGDLVAGTEVSRIGSAAS